MGLLVWPTFTATGISPSMLDGPPYSQVTQVTSPKKTIASPFKVITGKTLVAVLMVLPHTTFTRCLTPTLVTTQSNLTLDDLTPPLILTTVAAKMLPFLIPLTKNAAFFQMTPTLFTTINIIPMVLLLMTLLLTSTQEKTGGLVLTDQIEMPSEIWILTQMFKSLLLEAAVVWAVQLSLPMVSLTGVPTTTRRSKLRMHQSKLFLIVLFSHHVLIISNC